MTRFSTRTQPAIERTVWGMALESARERRPPPIDLTISNPTLVGLAQNIDPLARAGMAAVGVYAPEPLGCSATRDAVADYYRRRGRRCSPNRIWITSSTSEGYQQLFTILADPGETIALPRPGYPLLHDLARLAGLSVVDYALTWDDGGWHLDLESLARVPAHAPIRAIVAVSPNNPTGHVLSPVELERLMQLCLVLDCPLILDEVFGDYGPTASERCHPGLDDISVVTFVLSGLSKVAALPQAKLGWVACHGPEDAARQALSRVAWVADSQLAVAGWIQAATPAILGGLDDLQKEIRTRIRSNRALMRDRAAGSPVSLVPCEWGWSAILRLPAIGDLDDLGWSLLLLEHDDVVVQPGYLYDLGRDHHLVLSSIVSTASLCAGMDRIVARVQAVCAQA